MQTKKLTTNEFKSQLNLALSCMCTTSTDAVLPFGSVGDNHYYIQDVRQFNTAIDFISDHYKNSSRSQLVNRLMAVLAPRLWSDLGDFSFDEAAHIKAIEDELPVKKYTIYRPVSGFELGVSVAPVVIGDIVLSGSYDIDFPEHARKAFADMKLRWMYDKQDNVQVKVEACDSEKAVELADVRFERFERLMGFLIGATWGNTYVTEVIRPTALRSGTYISVCEDLSLSIKHGVAEHRVGVAEKFEEFTKLLSHYDQLFKAITAPHPSDLKKRLLTAAEWIGDAYRDSSEHNKIVKAMTALERVLVHTDGSVTSSIAAQVSESIALILGESSEQCIRLEADVKKMYSMRSKIVHHGERSFTRAQAIELLTTARAVVSVLLRSDEYQNIQSTNELQRYLQKLKYSARDKPIAIQNAET